MNRKKISARRPTPRRLAAGRRRGAPEKTDEDAAAEVSDAGETDAGEGEEPTANAARPPT
jgi:hypothetical protein